MAHDALGEHARDEVGLSELHAARPGQAAFTSALTFSLGAALPLLLAWLSPPSATMVLVACGSLLFLAMTGGMAAQAGGANLLVGAGRVTLWGALAMAATAGVGTLFGTVV